jgi:hypothetical protein
MLCLSSSSQINAEAAVDSSPQDIARRGTSSSERTEALLTVDYTEEQVEEALNVVRGSIDDIEASRSEDEWPAQQ